MSVADIPPSASKLLRKKSSASRFVDNGTAKTSITKRTKIPSTKALVPVPVHPERRFAYVGKVYANEDNIADVGELRAGWDTYNPDDLDIMEDIPIGVGFRGRTKTQKMRSGGQRSKFYEDVVDYEGNPKGKVGNARSNKASKAKSRINVGNNLKDFNKPVKNEPIDADYVEIPPSRFRKAPSRDARNLGLAKKSKSTEPAGIAAISKQKRQMKSELFKPSTKAQNVDTNYLIDKAFDELVHTGKGVVKAGKIAGKTAGKAVKEGLKATKAGLREFNEISEIVVQNPMLIRMGQAHEATLRGMASQRRHARGSIAAVGNNKRYVTAGSLVTQKGFVTHDNATVAPQTTTSLRVITKIVRRGNRDEVLYFLENGRQVTRNQARLIQEGILPPALENKASTTTEQAYSGNNAGSIMGKSAKSASGLVTRKNSGLGTTQTTGRTLHKPKMASPSGLITGAKNGLGATQMSNNPVLNIAKIASPSRLARRTHSGVV